MSYIDFIQKPYQIFKEHFYFNKTLKMVSPQEICSKAKQSMGTVWSEVACLHQRCACSSCSEGICPRGLPVGLHAGAQGLRAVLEVRRGQRHRHLGGWHVCSEEWDCRGTCTEEKGIHNTSTPDHTLRSLSNRAETMKIRIPHGKCLFSQCSHFVRDKTCFSFYRGSLTGNILQKK